MESLVLGRRKETPMHGLFLPFGRRMSIRAMVSVMDFAPAHWDSSTRLVAIIIADHVNDSTGECHPSIGRVAYRSGLSTRQVRRIMARLENENVIERKSRFENNRQTSNLYLWTNLVDIPVGGDTHVRGRGDTHDTLRGDTDVRVGGDAHVIQNPNRNTPFEAA